MTLHPDAEGDATTIVSVPCDRVVHHRQYSGSHRRRHHAASGSGCNRCSCARMSSTICSVPGLRRAVLVGVVWVVAGAGATAQQAPATLSPDQQREFLLTAKVVSSRPAGKGVTGTLRLTLSDGTVTHDAGFQAIDERMKPEDRARGKRRPASITSSTSIATASRRMRSRGCSASTT